ncbi:Transglycosylase-associated protein [Paraburkholderia sabiae]|uniref:GlsB/YeaQ/YmgE family stress response membrane protein n=1 Tax=Paraburkholderia sabiae TaxID=273251 RepID=UPI001CAE771C|nr:GlsB/YeaQ/YmgE family stress response membrane protein [Paraburkholderia sabiae]CAG9195335.1 Transglycosylase-associated protein [Paraburkholderia sabiae]
MEHGIIAWLIIGCIAGWLASVLVAGGGFGVIIDIAVGIAGAFIGSIITALIGAVILLFVIRLFRRG